MFEINSQKAIKIIILFALINSSVFIAFQPGPLIRFSIVGLMNLSAVLLVTYYLLLYKQQSQINVYYRVLLTLLLLWSMFTIGRSFTFDLDTIITLLGHYQTGAWVWLTPLALVFGLNVQNWFKSFNFFTLLLLIGSVLTVINLLMGGERAGGLIEWMAFLAVILLSYPYQNKMNKKVAIVAIAAYLVLSYEISQRINVLFIILLIGFVTIEFIRSGSDSLIKKGTIIFVLLLSMVLSPLVIDSFYDSVSQNKELTTDTRTFLFVELFDDMSTSEEIIGRGALGTYFSPYFYHTEKMGREGDAAQRSVNEVGYLEMILKGGYIMLFLYLAILIPAAYLGIFRSNNYLVRMCGYFIACYLIVWSLSYYPVYSAEYILLWMAAGTALSPSIRKLNNSEIEALRGGSG